MYTYKGVGHKTVNLTRITVYPVTCSCIYIYIKKIYRPQMPKAFIMYTPVDPAPQSILELRTPDALTVPVSTLLTESARSA